MSKHEISNVRTCGRGTIEKKISYKTEALEYQEILVTAQFEGDPTPEKIKQISEAIEKAAEEIGKTFIIWQEIQQDKNEQEEQE